MNVSQLAPRFVYLLGRFRVLAGSALTIVAARALVDTHIGFTSLRLPSV